MGGFSGGKRIDLSYPENDEIAEFEHVIEHDLPSQETVEIMGASISDVDDVNGDVFVWQDDSEHPPVVFQTPQSERRDQFGIYDFGETIYALDKSEEQQLNATTHDVAFSDEPLIEKKSGDSTFIVIDMEIENTGTETQKNVEALPKAVLDDRLVEQMMVFDNGKGLIEDPWGDSQIDIKLDETLTGILYIQIDKDLAPQAQLYYWDNQLFIYPEYAKKLNYNLEGKTE